MANIKPKKKPVIKKGNGFVYNPLTFYEEHHVENFIETDDPQEILSNIKPYEFMHRKFLFFDTEDHAHYASSHDVPPNVVRRWVGTGKKAVPIDFPFSMQFCDGEKAYCIYDTVENNFAKFKALAPLLEDPTIETVIHNAKFDMHAVQNAGMRIVGKIHDTVVLSKIANENRTSFRLADLAARSGGIVKFEGMVDSYKQLNHVTDYRQIPRLLLSQYGCADVWNLFKVFVKEYLSILKQDEDSKPGQTLEGLYETELEVMIALYAMERRGMRIDKDYEAELKGALQKKVDDAEAAVYEYAGKVFNMNSSKQLLEVMIQQGVDQSLFKYTEAGNVSLDKFQLERFDEIYDIPIIKRVQEYKKSEKLLNTYAVGIYSQMDSEGYVHGSINQTEATTGRMSITKPALQTLPKKNKSIRKMFIPEDDFEMWFMDLDQVEYRGFAHYAKALGLIEAINNGYDVHAATAAVVFHVDLDTIVNGMKEYDTLDEEQKLINGLMKNATPEEAAMYKARLDVLIVQLQELQQYTDMRARAKTVNFALVYGQGDDHTAEMLHVSLTEAKAFKARYFANIPEAMPFIKTVHAVIKNRGYVTNFYGRRRRLDVNDCYKAPNALIQGWAADFIKSKLVNIYKYMIYNKLKSYLSNIVHDELVEEIHKTETEHIPTLRWLLSDFDNYRCKITAGVDYGDPSWGQKKVPVNDIGFKKPEDMSYLDIDLFDGHVFDINM